MWPPKSHEVLRYRGDLMNIKLAPANTTPANGYSQGCNCSTVMYAAFTLIDDRVGVSDSCADDNNIIITYNNNQFSQFIKHILEHAACISLRGGNGRRHGGMEMMSCVTSFTHGTGLQRLQALF